MPIGTFVNIIAVLIGGSLGLIFTKNLPERFKNIAFQAIGLGVLVIGVKMSLVTNNLLILVFSLIIGGLLGELFHLEKNTEKASERLKNLIKSNNPKFVEGLVSTTVLFCVGSMTILGAINEGLYQDRTLYYTKAVLDGFTAIALASYYGSAVLFSVIPMLIIQGGLTILAYYFAPFLSEQVINEITAVGGVLIIGIAFNMLNIKQIKLLNLLPALFVVVLLVWGSAVFGV